MAQAPPALRAVEEAASDKGALRAFVEELRAADDSLARALRRSAGALQADPLLALPSLYALCWFDGAETTRAVLRQWIAEWQRLNRGSWLRALRPPLFSLDSPLIEEYAGVDEDAVPWFTSAGVVGARRPPATTQDRYVVDNAKRTFGLLALKDVTTGGRVVIKVHDEPMLTNAVTLPNGDVVAAGWYLDYQGMVVRARPSTRTLLWRAELNDQVWGLQLSPDGSRVLLTLDDGRRAMLSVDTGQELASYAPAPGSAAIAPDNRHIAVCQQGTLRVWRPLDPQSTWSYPSGTSSFGGTQFSPSGRLLLSGTHLFDTKTGRLLASLDIERPGYLEGGPAQGCTALLDSGVVEGGAFRGFRVWNASGELVLCDTDRRYFLGSCLAFSPNGRFYAVASARGPITIREVLTGQAARVVERDNCPCLAWSRDGDWLANVSRDGHVHVSSPSGAEERLGRHEQVKHLAFSIDDAWLATGSGSTDKLWRRGSSTAVAERDRVPSDARRSWNDALHGWSGFRAHAHDRQGRLLRGIFEVLDRDGRSLARIPSDEYLLASPDGNHWASAHAHYVLELGS